MLSTLLDTIFMVVLVFALILGARAWQTGELAAWAYDNLPFALADTIVPDGAPGVPEARQAAMVETVLEPVVEEVTKLVEPATQLLEPVKMVVEEKVETFEEWAKIDVPPLPPVVGPVVETVTELLNIPTPTPTPSATPTPTVVAFVSERYKSRAFVSLCEVVAASPWDVLVVEVGYPDESRDSFSIYPDKVERHADTGEHRGVGFYVHPPQSPTLRYTFAYGDPGVLQAIAQRIGQYKPAMTEANAGQGAASHKGATN